MDKSISLEDLQYKIQNFIYYFLRKVEQQFEFYLSYLEGESPSKSISLTTNIAAETAKSIPLPIVGTVASFGITQGDVMRGRKADKDTAVALSEIIYYHSCKKDEVRKVLIKAAYELFCCYEMQFLQLTCNGGNTRAMQKLGYDAAERYVKFLSKNKTEVIERELILKSIIHYESSLLTSLGISKKGHHVKDKDNTTWNIPKLYTKVGVYDKENNTYFKNKNSNTLKYGYRLKFMHETIEFMEENYEKEDVSHNHNYILSFDNFDKDYRKILEFVFSKDPLEFAKFDREVKQEQLLMEMQVKHEQAEADRQIKFVETKEYLESIKSEVAANKVEIEKKITQIAEQNVVILEKSAESVLEPTIKLGEVLKTELKNIDPTRNPKFKELKKKIRKIRL